MSPSSERLIGPRDVKASKPALLADPIYHHVLALVLEYDPQTVSHAVSKMVVFFFFLRDVVSRKEVVRVLCVRLC